MKRGFTLIELLAVIVILAIIALIATPIILNIINDTKVSANERSAELYLDAVEQAIIDENLNRLEGFNPQECQINSDGNLVCDNQSTPVVVSINGTKPTGGTITFLNSKILSAIINYGTFTANLTNGKIKISNTPCTRSGNEVTCSTEQFYVIAEDATTATLFAKYNLDTGIQMEVDRICYVHYWNTYEECVSYGILIENDCAELVYPYCDDWGEETILFTTVNNSPTYKQSSTANGYDSSSSDPYYGVLGNLNSSTVLAAYQSALQTLGVTVNSIRIPTYNNIEEEVEISCETLCEECNYDCPSCDESECSGTTLVLRLVESGDMVNILDHNWYNTTSYIIFDSEGMYDGILKNNNNISEHCPEGDPSCSGYGIRPVVVIPKSNIG